MRTHISFVHQDPSIYSLKKKWKKLHPMCYISHLGGRSLARRGTTSGGRVTTRGRAAAHTATAVLVLNATRLVEEGSRSDALGEGGVDAKGQPGEEAVADVVTEQGVLHHGVDAISLSLLAEDAVVGVGGELLGVGVVGGGQLDLGDEVLVEEGLADVAGVVVAAEGAVGVEGGVGVDHDVDVGGTAGVVAGEDGLELGDAVRVGLLDAAEPGVVDVGLVGAVAVSAGHDARVDTGGIAVPHLEVDVGDGLAGVDVNDLVVEDDVDTLLLLDEVAADIFTSDVYTVLVTQSY